jgi:GNAT superfamily N-acetyltransferase
MKIRLAVPDEAEACWNVRNQAIRHGCKNSYDSAVIKAWTPEAMPESYREVITENPFFVVEGPDSKPVATGYLDLSSGSIEAIFTSPDYVGKGLASTILDAIKGEARQRGFSRLTLSSTPNARTFYEKQGFMFLQESTCPSRLAQTDLRCMEMSIEL